MMKADVLDVGLIQAHCSRPLNPETLDNTRAIRGAHPNSSTTTPLEAAKPK